MRILIDKYIPYLRGVLEPYAEVRYLEPEEFTPANVWEADALFIRTRTKVNSTLLQGSRVRLVCTATIGYDHIDTAYCEQQQIRWTNAPGCNAQAVCNYIEEALRELDRLGHIDLSTHPTVGIVGVGHVGSLVATMAEELGCRILLNDLPEVVEQSPFARELFVSLDEIARCSDVITFHTPLVKEGANATYHLCGAQFLSQCQPQAVIINAARGGIVDEQALMLAGNPCVIDTWENEPHLNSDMLEHTVLASQHIAGYSIQGKINASTACLRALCDEFHIPALSIDAKQVPLPGDNESGWLLRLTETLKQNPFCFESLRESYPLR